MKTIKIRLIGITAVVIGLLGSASTADAAFWDDGGAPDNEWATAANWNLDTYPLNDIAQVNGGYTATQSTGTPGDVGQIRIGNTTDGTLNITGGTLTASTTGSQTGVAHIGYNNGATGTLNMSGGTLVATSLFIGSLGTGTSGIATVSGGTIDLSVDLRIARAAGTSGLLTIVGDSPTIDVGTNFLVENNGTLRFDLGATSVSTIDALGDFDINTGADLIIDGSSYTSGPGIIDLVTFGSLLDSTWSSITIQNFSGLSGEVLFDADSMFLQLTSAIPEPAAFALLMLGLGALCFQRPRRVR